MDTQKPYYRKATGHPVYYWIDPETKQIESVKNWGDRPKSIERYVYQEAFAQNIRDSYKEIPERYYKAIRVYVLQMIARYMGIGWEGLFPPVVYEGDREVGEEPQ
ncbi:MAG: hypothetical protein AAFW00_06635 [Bacteroidota bacterium]